MFYWMLLLLGSVICAPIHSPLFGVITSPNFPHPYPNNNQRTWNITVPEGHEITIIFMVFNLESSDNCTKDFVKIMSGEVELTRWCGSMEFPSHPGSKTFVYQADLVRIHFQSDLSSQNSGFLVNYWTQVVSCKEPQPLTNGKITYVTAPGILTYQSVITYSCNTPYYRMENATRSVRFTCSAQRVWEDENGGRQIPPCVPVCGKPKNPVISISRIIAGKLAKPGNFPWQVSINTDIGSSAGVLIGEHWVLTTAQVICSVKEEQRYIYMGNVEKKSNLEHHAVEEIHVHPDYNNRTYDNDIALIRLRDPVIMNQNVSPICLPGPDNNILYDADKMGYVSGFGVNEKGHTSGHLLYVDIPMVSRARCKEYLKRKMSKYVIFTKNMFCAGFPESTIHKGDSCSGDSGGPYASKDQNGTWVVTGLVSWGFVCGKGYGFYTKVSNYLGWIQEYIGG